MLLSYVTYLYVYLYYVDSFYISPKLSAYKSKCQLQNKNFKQERAVQYPEPFYFLNE